MPFDNPHTIKNQTKKDLLADKILEMIYSGLLQDGDDLPSERELAKLFGTSRETVRGALSKLSGLGLISTTQGSKSRIHATKDGLKNLNHLYQTALLDTNAYTLDDVFVTRTAIECTVIELTAQKITAKDIDKLAKMVEYQTNLHHDPLRFQLSDREFHRQIAQISQNPLLIKYSSELYNHNLVARRRVMSLPSAIKRSVCEHQEIINALKSGDTVRCMDKMSVHLNSVYQSSLRT